MIPTVSDRDLSIQLDYNFAVEDKLCVTCHKYCFICVFYCEICFTRGTGGLSQKFMSKDKKD